MYFVTKIVVVVVVHAQHADPFPCLQLRQKFSEPALVVSVEPRAARVPGRDGQIHEHHPGAVRRELSHQPAQGLERCVR